MFSGSAAVLAASTIQEALAIAREVAAQARLVEAETLQRVAVDGALLARVLHRPAAHARRHLLAEREPGEGVDPGRLRQRVRDQILVAEVEEAILVGLAHVHAAADRAPELPAPLAPHLDGVDAIAREHAQAVDQARERRNALGRLAVGPHDAHVGKGAEQHVHVPQMERGLEDPALARLAAPPLLPLEEAEQAHQIVVAGRQILGLAPGARTRESGRRPRDWSRGRRARPA